MASIYTESVRTLRGILGWDQSSSTAGSSTSRGVDQGGPEQGEHNASIGTGTSTLKPARVNRISRRRPTLGHLFEDVSTATASGSPRDSTADSSLPPDKSPIEGAVPDSAARPDVEGKAKHGEADEVDQTTLHDDDEEDDKILFQAGTSCDLLDPEDDREFPLLVGCPCNLPDESSQQLQTLNRLTARLESFAQEPYLLVLFASPTPTLPVSHLVSCYRSLSRQARRSVKRIWVCHPGLLTKIAVKLFLNTIVSGKVSRKGKVRLVDSLSQLAGFIDITQLDIPADVYTYNLQCEKQINLPARLQPQPVFGASLSQVMSDAHVPLVVANCMKELRRDDHLTTPGLFRKAPKHSLLNQLRDAYDRGHPVDIARWPDSTSLAASLLKLYLRSLPDPLVPPFLYDRLQAAPVDPDGAVRWIRRRFIRDLSKGHPDGDKAVCLLKEVIKLLSEVAKSSDLNKMNSQNLAIVMAPVLLRSDDVKIDAEMCRLPDGGQGGALPWATRKEAGAEPQDKQTFGTLLKVMIERYEEIFEDPVGRGQRHGTIRPAMSPSLSSLSSLSSQESTGSKTLETMETRESVRGMFAGWGAEAPAGDV